MKTVSVEIGSHSGDRETCEITFSPGVPMHLDFQSEKFGLLSFVGESLFDVLCKLRLRLECENYLLLCNVSRKDAYPSRMAQQMGAGIYLLKHGVQARRENLVDVFGFSPIEEVGSVVEQRANFDAWIKSLADS